MINAAILGGDEHGSHVNEEIINPVGLWLLTKENYIHINMLKQKPELNMSTFC